MKRKERMEWYIERICRLLKRLPVTQANEIEVKALWFNVGSSHADLVNKEAK